MIHTKESLAALLDGREIRNEVQGLDCPSIKAARLLIVYGASDDLVEFDGLFRDEAGAGGRATDIRFDEEGVPQEWEEFINDSVTIETAKKQIARLENAKSLTAFWCRKDCSPWTFETSLPHAKFKIMEDGEVFCEGLVIDMKPTP